jgi:hypothetical protein
MTFFLDSGVSIILAWLGHGIFNSFFWRSVLAGSIGAAIIILIAGYTINHLDHIVKKTMSIVYMS